MTGNWLDKAAKRAAQGGPERTALDELAIRSTEPMSRRTGIKLALGAALTATAAPLMNVGTAQALFCGKHSAGVCLSDGGIISATDQFFEAAVAGQELEIFGLLDAALVFYEAAETLDSGCTSPDIQCGGACCTDGQICCTCNGGFCLVAGGDCSSYC